MKTRIGIMGYGNLGRGVEIAVNAADDMELAAVFTRRAPETVKILSPDVPVVHADEAEQWKDKIDVLILCGGRVNGIVDARHTTKEEVGLLMTNLREEGASHEQ